MRSSPHPGSHSDFDIPDQATPQYSDLNTPSLDATSSVGLRLKSIASQKNLQGLRTSLFDSLGTPPQQTSRVPSPSSIATRLELIETPIPPNPAHTVPETPPTWPSTPADGRFTLGPRGSTTHPLQELTPRNNSQSYQQGSSSSSQPSTLPPPPAEPSALRRRQPFHSASEALEKSQGTDLDFNRHIAPTADLKFASSTNSSGATSPTSLTTPESEDADRPSMVRSGYLPLHDSQRRYPRPFHRLLSWFAKNVKAILGLSLLSVVLLQGVLYIPYMMGQERMRSWGLEAIPAKSPPEWFSPGWRPYPPPSGPPPPPPPPHGPVDHYHPPAGPPPGNHFPPYVHPSEPPMQPTDPPYSPISDKLRIGPEAFPVPYSKSYSYDPAHAYPDGDPHTGVIPPLQLNILKAEKPWKRPSKPPQAPLINDTLWHRIPWSRKINGSQTAFSDSYKAHLQPLSPDFREPPFAGWRPPLALLNVDSPPAEQLGRIQFAFEDPSRHSGANGNTARDELLKGRQKLVKAAFRHAWEGYKALAWGHDELKPVSELAQDNFNGWGASIVDALDTLLIMDLPEDYNLAREHVHDIDFRKIGGERSAYGGQDGRIPVFETAIRYLGGFLAAYDLSGDELMRDRAEELAQLMEPAFGTRTGVPVGRIRFGSGVTAGASTSSVLAEAGSMLLEYTRLWQVTGNREYFDRVQRTTDWLDRNMTQQSKLGALLPTTLYPETGGGAGVFSFGGMSDSYYEYLPKQHQLMGGRLPQYSRMYGDAIKSARKWLIRDIPTVPNTQLLTIGLSSRSHFEAKLEHLACFAGGMLGLGSKLIPSQADDYDLAQRMTETCWWTYNSSATGIGPEDTVFYRVTDTDRWNVVTQTDGTKRRDGPNGYPVVGVRRQTKDYRGRPETIESVLYMWRITGDPVWQERGWQMFCSWVTHSMTRVGFANIHDVTQVPAMLADSMESFVFAETFKYYYLLFSPPDLISLDEYVFTTEAHPLLVPQKGRWTQPATGSKKFWDPASMNAAVDADDIYGGGEREAYGGLTNAQKHDIYETWSRKVERQRKQDEMMRAKAKLNGIVERAMNAGGDSVSALVSRMKHVIGITERQEEQQHQQARSSGDPNLRDRDLHEGAVDVSREQIQEAIKRAVEQIRAQTLAETAEQTAAVSALDQAAAAEADPGEEDPVSVVIETERGPLEIRFTDSLASDQADAFPATTLDDSGSASIASESIADKLEAMLSHFDPHAVDDEPLFAETANGCDAEPSSEDPDRVEAAADSDNHNSMCAAEKLTYDSGISIHVEDAPSDPSPTSALPGVDLEGIQAAGIGALRSALFRLNEAATAAGMPIDLYNTEDEEEGSTTGGGRKISPRLRAKLEAMQEEQRLAADEDVNAAHRLGMGFGGRMYQAAGAR